MESIEAMLLVRLMDALDRTYPDRVLTPERFEELKLAAINLATAYRNFPQQSQSEPR